MGKGVAVVGVVFRGSLWLDGAFVSILKNAREPERDLAQAIKNCKQYSQLHALILSKEKNTRRNHINDRELYRRIKLPVITVHRTRPRKIRNMFQIQAGREQILVGLVGITPERAQEIFEVTRTAKRWIPEPLRVAELIASSI